MSVKYPPLISVHGSIRTEENALLDVEYIACPRWVLDVSLKLLSLLSLPDMLCDPTDLIWR